MARQRKDPLRPLTDDERIWLARISRATSEPARHVARATAVLAVAKGQTDQAAAAAAGRRSNDAGAQLVARFTQLGRAARVPAPAGGVAPIETTRERERIVAAARRTPLREHHGTATWALSTRRQAWRPAPHGLPTVSNDPSWRVLHDAGWSWQHRRTWCATGTARRQRTDGVVAVTAADAEAKHRD